jgi:hypothetical protein
MSIDFDTSNEPFLQERLIFEKFHNFWSVTVIKLNEKKLSGIALVVYVVKKLQFSRIRQG